MTERLPAMRMNSIGVSVSMRKPVVGNVAAVKPLARVVTWNNQPATIVCGGLLLAILALAFRIASVW
jgi:hypothetical protein